MSSFLRWLLGYEEPEVVAHFPMLDLSRAVTLADLHRLQLLMWRHHEPDQPTGFGWSEEIGTLSAAEVQAILSTVDSLGLVCQLCAVGFGFGQIGMNICEDEPYPGVGPQFVFCLSERHLDAVDFPWVEKPTLGNVHNEAVELFQAALRPKNVMRLHALGLRHVSPGELAY